jgi:hypothetical protein
MEFAMHQFGKRNDIVVMLYIGVAVRIGRPRVHPVWNIDNSVDWFHGDWVYDITIDVLVPHMKLYGFYLNKPTRLHLLFADWQWYARERLWQSCATCATAWGTLHHEII